jgi:hypothetical protein
MLSKELLDAAHEHRFLLIESQQEGSKLLERIQKLTIFRQCPASVRTQSTNSCADQQRPVTAA